MIAQRPNEHDGFEDARMLTAADLAKSLRISTRQCWRLNKNKLLPAPARIGDRIIRWSAAEIADWVKAGSPCRAEWENGVRERALVAEDAGRE